LYRVCYFSEWLLSWPGREELPLLSVSSEWPLSGPGREE
jgi:hypothetical protein